MLIRTFAAISEQIDNIPIVQGNIAKIDQRANKLRASYKLAQMFHMTPMFVKKKYTALPIEDSEKFDFFGGWGVKF